MDVRERITVAFKEFSARSTRPRQLIAEGLIHLGETGEAFSAEDLLAMVRKSDPRVGRATVYRSVDKLVGMKVLDRIDFVDGTHYFRMCGSGDHHHHLACTKCHRVVDLHVCLDEEQFREIGRREKFRIDDHSITLFGLCSKCRKA